MCLRPPWARRARRDQSRVTELPSTLSFAAGTAVELDSGISLSDPEVGDEMETQQDNPLSWGLDRIDAQSGLHQSYNPPAGSTEAGAHVYVWDTGIRVTRSVFVWAAPSPRSA